MESGLTSQELDTLARIARQGSDTHARRARLLLLRGQGTPVSAIAEEVGLSRGQVYSWLRAFRARRLAIFPLELISDADRLPPRRSRRKREAPDLVRDDVMSEAGRKVLRFHFRRMLRHEPGTRQGDDIEELHDMRVATRRMRSAFRVFAPYFDRELLRPLVKGLRRTGRALGRVRDLDVILDNARTFIEAQPPDEKPNLSPLLADWERQRDETRADLLEFLDGKRYRRFVDQFGQFLDTPGAGAAIPASDSPPAQRVDQAARVLLYTRYDAVRAYEPHLADAPLETLHALRIDCKMLRYSLEFFRRVLAPEAEKAIKEVVTVQDHLGALNDSDVATRLLTGFLSQWSTREGRERIDVRGVILYLMDRQNALHELLAGFPDVWHHFSRPEIQRLLTRSVLGLRAAADTER
jgi:CHAD domain-containing protein